MGHGRTGGLLRPAGRRIRRDRHRRPGRRDRRGVRPGVGRARPRAQSAAAWSRARRGLRDRPVRPVPARVCGGTGSKRALKIARTRIPSAQLVRAGVPALPFGDATFDRLFTSHFYGHLVQTEGMAFLAEARRVAPELVVVDTAAYEGVRPDGWQERVLRDGSRYTIYKRHFTAEGLLAELGGDGEVLFARRFFVAAVAPAIPSGNSGWRREEP